MGQATLQDLLSALSAIRSASDGVRGKGWIVADELVDTIQSRLPVLRHSHGLAPTLEQKQHQILVLCEAWLRIFTLARTYPHSEEQRIFGIERAATLVARIDELLTEVGSLKSTAAPQS